MYRLSISDLLTYGVQGEEGLGALTPARCCFPPSRLLPSALHSLPTGLLELNLKEVTRTQRRPRGRLLQPSEASRLRASPSRLCPLRLANGETQNCVPAEQTLSFAGEKNLPAAGLVSQGGEETGWMEGLADSLSDDWEGRAAPPAAQESPDCAAADGQVVRPALRP